LPEDKETILSALHTKLCEIIAPISDLTDSRAPNAVEWGEKQEKAFTQIKQRGTNP